jgi:tetratricopeptide (TPR) repeat protein
MKKLCLTMIVKNESRVIRETLDSVLAFLDYWIIVDTGSTDGTQDLVWEYFADRGIPGELHERPWKNFGYNRTEAFRLAEGKAEYLWVIDADDVLRGDLVLPAVLDRDSYWLYHRTASAGYWRPQIFRSACHWEYKGVLHEYVESPHAATFAKIEGSYYIDVRSLGDRSRDLVLKFQRDEQLLLKGIQEEPDNARYHFYLAQTYRDAGNPAKALEFYAKREQMGGFAEEVYYAKYMKMVCQMCCGASFQDWLYTGLDAFAYRPTRLESLYEIVKHCRETEKPRLGYQLGKAQEQAAMPADLLFVDREIHEWKFLDELAVCAYWAGDFAMCRRINERILAENKSPAHHRDRLMTNLSFAVKNL